MFLLFRGKGRWACWRKERCFVSISLWSYWPPRLWLFLVVIRPWGWLILCSVDKFSLGLGAITPSWPNHLTYSLFLHSTQSHCNPPPPPSNVVYEGGYLAGTMQWLFSHAVWELAVGRDVCLFFCLPLGLLDSLGGTEAEVLIWGKWGLAGGGSRGCWIISDHLTRPAVTAYQWLWKREQVRGLGQASRGCHSDIVVGRMQLSCSVMLCSIYLWGQNLELGMMSHTHTQVKCVPIQEVGNPLRSLVLLF